MTFKIKSILAILASVAVIGAANAQMEIKLGHVGEPGSLFAKSSEEYRSRFWGVGLRRIGHARLHSLFWFGGEGSFGAPRALRAKNRAAVCCGR